MTLDEAVLYIKAHWGMLKLQEPKYDWVAGCFKSGHPRSPYLVVHAASPTAAVEKLKAKMEKKRRPHGQVPVQDSR